MPPIALAEADPGEMALPIDLTGWVVLIASFAITIGWLVYLYRYS